MQKKTLLGLAVAGCVMAACHSAQYRIQGKGKVLAEGDTLFLTSDVARLTPCDTAVVRDGMFELSGTADSARFVLLYHARRPEINVPFFIEPGHITLIMSETQGGSRVSGTPINREWQRLNDSMMVVGREVNLIAERIYREDATLDRQQQGMARIEQLTEDFRRTMADFEKRNSHNELGRFLRATYPEMLP